MSESDRNLVPVLLADEPMEEGKGPAVLPAEPAPQQAAPDGAGPQGDLHLVAVGVTRYRIERLNLRFAAADAGAIAEAFLAEEGRTFRKVYVTLLCDEKATLRAVKDAIERLQRISLRPTDVAVLFLAGHGTNSEATGLYFFLPHDADADAPIATAIDGSVLINHFVKMRSAGARLLLIDTCHAGNVDSDNRLVFTRDHPQADPHDAKALVDQVERDAARGLGDGGAIILAACGERESAKESSSWSHGAFTRALLDAMAGEADVDGQGRIDIQKLVNFIGPRVRRLTRGKQRPMMAPDKITSDLALVCAPDPLIGYGFDDYQILRKLSANDQVAVYEAEKSGGGRVWLKALMPSLMPPQNESTAPETDKGGKESPARRFKDAAILLQQAAAPGFVQILGTGDLPGPRPYLLIEPYAGQPLNDPQALRRDPSRALRILARIAATLQAAHAQGVVYLGLCPGRIVLGDGDQVRLLDCASVRRAKSPLPLLDRRPKGEVDNLDSEVLYLAPELVDTYRSFEDLPPTQAGPAADVYALGVLAHLLLSGHVPFPGPATESVLAAHQKDAPPLLSGVRRPWRDLVHRMLAKTPAERPTMAEVAARLARAPTVLDRVFAQPGRIAAAALSAMALAVVGVGVYRWAAEGPGEGLKGGPPSVPQSASDLRPAPAPDLRPAAHPEPPRPPVVPGMAYLAGAGEIRPFYLDRHEVTNAALSDWLNRQPGLKIDGEEVRDRGGRLLLNLSTRFGGIVRQDGRYAARPGQERRPAVQVSFAAASAFCSADRKRLAKEAEWEIAARGPARDRAFPWGAEAPRCDGSVIARGGKGICAAQGEGAAEVGSGKQDVTDEGVTDLLGNVSEWVAPATVTTEPKKLPVRGSNWARPAERWADRAEVPAASVGASLGFRCAKTAPTGAAVPPIKGG